MVSRPGFALEPPDGLTLSAKQWERVHLLDSVHEEVAATDFAAAAEGWGSVPGFAAGGGGVVYRQSRLVTEENVQRAKNPLP